MGTPGAWLNRLSQFTIETPSSRKPRKADRPAEQKKVVSKKGGLQQVPETPPMMIERDLCCLGFVTTSPGVVLTE